MHREANYCAKRKAATTAATTTLAKKTTGEKRNNCSWLNTQNGEEVAEKTATFGRRPLKWPANWPKRSKGGWCFFYLFFRVVFVGNWPCKLAKRRSKREGTRAKTGSSTLMSAKRKKKKIQRKNTGKNTSGKRSSSSPPEMGYSISGYALGFIYVLGIPLDILIFLIYKDL